MTPTHYTTHLKEVQQYIWLAWPTDVKFQFSWTKQRSATSVKMGPLDVVSLAFDDPAFGYTNFLRWDCENGFNNITV